MKKRSIRHSLAATEEQHRDRWLISYADLVTLLLALFIVMYAASDQQRAKTIAESFSSQNGGDRGIMPGSDSVTEAEKNQKILNDNPVLAEHSKIRKTERGLIVSLAEAGFFLPGEAAINSGGDQIISALAESLRQTNSQVRVEGHTDSTPISNAKYSSNWETFHRPSRQRFAASRATRNPTRTPLGSGLRWFSAGRR